MSEIGHRTRHDCPAPARPRSIQFSAAASVGRSDHACRNSLWEHHSTRKTSAAIGKMTTGKFTDNSADRNSPNVAGGVHGGKYMEVRSANPADVVKYAALGRDAQTWLRSRGLSQYVPAAHDEYAVAIRLRVESGTLFAVQDGHEAIGYFSLDASPSPWWPTDTTPALYLAGMVVARSARHREIGTFIIEWSITEANRLGLNYLRLDCHADNAWLCRYYQAHGFQLRGHVEQNPGYYGCLYQREVDGAAWHPQ
jgi:GNAT superfamily N-acetyltransferase